MKLYIGLLIAVAIQLNEGAWLNRTMISQSCVAGWTRVGDKCYKMDPAVFLSFEKASESCSQDGGMLTGVHSIKELRAIGEKMIPEGYKFGIWLGGFRNNNGGKTWHWTDSTEFNWVNWGKKQPDNPRQNCIQLNHFRWMGRPLLFDNDYCQAKRAFICSRPLYHDYPYSQFTKLAEDGKCPEPYTHKIGDQCFKLFTDNRSSWSEAVEHCHKLGGWLPSLHSCPGAKAIAKQLLNSACIDPVWVGGFRAVHSDGKFHWSDASWWNYSNWAKGEPNMFGQQNCVAMNDLSKVNKRQNRHLMATQNCNRRLSYICAIKANNFGYAYAG